MEVQFKVFVEKEEYGYSLIIGEYSTCPTCNHKILGRHVRIDLPTFEVTKQDLLEKFEAVVRFLSDE